MATILICDDERDIVNALDIYLSSEGYEVVKAYNGAEALEAIEAGRVDLVLLDIMMPVMNGLDATKTIRNTGRSDASVPIIAMTANAYEEDKKECIRAGMNEHIAKPLEEREIMVAISKYVH